jgi:hypothetical protein
VSIQPTERPIADQIDFLRWQLGIPGGDRTASAPPG